MFDARVRLMSDDGRIRGKVLQTLSFSATFVDSASSTISFVVSEKVAGRMDAPQVVSVEYSTGGPYVSPRNGLFMAKQDGSDDADPAGTVRFTGEAFIPWFLARTYIHWTSHAKNGERLWTPADGSPVSAGFIMHGMLTESQNRGWAPFISWDATNDKDSAGATWGAEEKIAQRYKLLTPVSQVLQGLAEQGLCDWWAQGTTLRLFRPGTGVIRQNVVLGGPAFSSRPVKSSFDDVFTNLTVVPEKARNWLYLTNTGATSRFGRLEATMTQSGIEDHATATKLAQPVLTGGRAVKREYSFDWSPAVAGPIPFADFNIGDVVTSKTRHGRNPQRVIGIQLSKQDAKISARAIVGDKLLSLAARQIRRTGGGSIGGTIGGSGNTIPVSNGPTYAVPDAPTGLHVESNTAIWRSDGTAQATVKLAWNAVTQATDGSGVDVKDYQVSARIASATSAIVATTEDLSFTTSSWPPLIARYVKVRARSFSGDVSEWTNEIAVVPVMPASIVPKAPTGLKVVSNVGAFLKDNTAVANVVVEWNPVTSSVENTPVEIEEYEVRAGLDTWRVTGTTGTFTIPSRETAEVAVRAKTTIGIWGDPSTSINVTGAEPPATLAAPTDPELDSWMGVVSSRWDGMLTTGAPPYGFGTVLTETAPAAAGPWTAAATPLRAAGTSIIRGVVGDTVFVRFRSYDALGRAGKYSGVVSTTVTGVPLGELAPDLLDAIDQVRFTADGKNRIYASVEQPDGNLAPNPSFVDGVTGWSARSGGGAASSLVRITNANATDIGSSYARLTLDTAGTWWRASSELIDVVPGASYTFSGWVTGSPTATNGHLIIGWRNASGSFTEVAASSLTFDGTWTEYEVTATAPAGTTGARLEIGRSTGAVGNTIRMTRIRFTEGEPIKLAQGDQWWVLNESRTSILGVKVWDGDTWNSFQFVADSIVAPGSITSPLIRAGAIEVAHVEAGFGGALNIEANDSITLITGRLDDVELHVRIDSDAMRLGRPDGVSELELSPEGIAMKQNNVTISQWIGGVFIADEAQLDSATIGNHQWMSYGNARTIVRPI